MSTSKLVRRNLYEVSAPGTVIDTLLAKANFLHDASDVLNLCSQERLLLNDAKLQTNQKVVPGDVITLLTPQELEPQVSDDVVLLYEDDYFFAVSKPAQLPVHPSGRYYFNTLSSVVERKLGLCGLYPYNRIDRETSGIVLFAKQAEYISLLQNTTVDKWYYALVFGVLKKPKGVIQAPLVQKTVGELRHHIVVDSQGKEATTEYEVVDSTRDYSLVRVQLITGRKHQIRAHFAHLGHPLVGDKQYGKYPELLIAYSQGVLDEQDVVNKVASPRQLLHCYKVEFRHPKSGELVVIEDKIREYFLEFLKKHDLKLL